MSLCIDTLSLMVKYGLLEETIILQLSYVCQRLKDAYKKYVTAIKPIECFDEDLKKIFQHNKILALHKHEITINLFARRSFFCIKWDIINTTNDYIIKWFYKLFLVYENSKFHGDFCIIYIAFTKGKIDFLLKFLQLFTSKLEYFNKFPLLLSFVDRNYIHQSITHYSTKILIDSLPPHQECKKLMFDIVSFISESNIPYDTLNMILSSCIDLGLSECIVKCSEIVTE